MLVRAHEVLEPMFVDSVLPESGHSILAKSEHWEALLDTLPDAAKCVADNMLKKWSSGKDALTTPEEKWSGATAAAGDRADRLAAVSYRVTAPGSFRRPLSFVLKCL